LLASVAAKHAQNMQRTTLTKSLIEDMSEHYHCVTVLLLSPVH
jgi:hypothetical protein